MKKGKAKNNKKGSDRQKHSSLRRFAVIFSWCITISIAATSLWWASYDPNVEDDIQVFQADKTYLYCGNLKNTSAWKHADKLVFKGSFENGSVDTLDPKPQCDILDRSVKSEQHVEFSLNRLSTGKTCGILIIVNALGEIKDDLHVTWGNRGNKKIAVKSPSTKEQSIFNAGISAKERDHSFRSNAAKIR